VLVALAPVALARSPQTTLVAFVALHAPQTMLEPQTTLDPHTTLEPQTTLDPHTTL